MAEKWEYANKLGISGDNQMKNILRKKTEQETSDSKKSFILGVIGIIISVVALIVTFVSFILPLLRTRLVIEDPAQIYTVKTNKNHDEIIIPVVMTNYGNYIRSINGIECTLEYKGNLIPMKPTYIYDEVYYSQEECAKKKFYSSFNLEPNSSCVKYIGFVYNDSNFTYMDKVPERFRFESDTLYTFHARFYTTRNFFTRNDREVIQVLYVFETGNLNEFNSVYNPSKSSCMKITDHNIFLAYK